MSVPFANTQRLYSPFLYCGNVYYKPETGGEKLPNITVKIPSDIVDIIGEGKNIEKESRMLIATELYREGEISVGKAAELAGLPFEDFIEELKYRKMRIYSLLGIPEAKDEESMVEKYFE
jgi:predicted HTH domain antitoxin